LRRIINAMTINFSPLRASRDFRLIFIGQFVSAFGSAISYVVLPWQMYQLTKSPFYVGLLGVAEFVPMFVMGFVGGALADHVNRRLLIVLTEVGLILCSLALIANSLLARPSVWALLAISAAVAALGGIQRPAREALTPPIVSAEQMPAVAALQSLRFNFNCRPVHRVGRRAVHRWRCGVGGLAACVHPRRQPRRSSQKRGRCSSPTVREGWQGI
jgi:MFS family permease